MKINKIKIGDIEIPNNVLLAPLAGFTDMAFRTLCLRLGAGLAFTEMVSGKGLIYGSENTEKLLLTSSEERVKALQIFGCDADILERAVKDSRLDKFQIIDFNMGCPVHKVYKNGEGSALLNDISLASKIISRLSSCGKTITAKIRIGVKTDNFITREFVEMLEESGAKMITVHGRTREGLYSEKVNFEQIAIAKQSAKRVLVIANGSIFSEEDADKMLEETGADGVMLARGALYNPFLFARLTGKEVKEDMHSFILEQIALMQTYETDDYIVRNLRKNLNYYLKGKRGSKILKTRILNCNDLNSLKEMLAEYFTC